MSAWKIMVAVVVLLLPVAASAAPAGKVIIAQGVDPTTLDMANQSGARRRTSGGTSSTRSTSATRI